MPWYLYLALKQLFPTGKRLSFFTAISILGVALGVATLVVTNSVMGGFGYEIRRMIIDTQGDVQIRANGLIEKAEPLIDTVSKVPGVLGVTPFAEGVGMLEYGRKPAFPLIQGVDVNRVNDVIPLNRFIRVGSLDELDDDTVILSSQLAYSLGAQIGAKVTITSPLLIERLKNDEVFLPRELTIVGIFEIGHQQLDSNTVLVTLRRMQDLYGLGEAVHGLNVKIDPKLDADAMATRINAVLPTQPETRARSWIEANSEFLFVLQMEKNLVSILLLFIILVASFSIMSSLLTTVVRKTREIGLLGALGGRSRDIAACFCVQGFLIGFIGTGTGLALGFAFLEERNNILLLFTKLTGSRETLERFYQFSNVPAHIESIDLVVIIVGTIVISTLAGIFPAWRASKLNPVEALRNE
ncbi:MAG: ABC transporter permease [Opitutaceae bacterium]|jgi:lipoprotein-releasing system permease protein